MRRKHDDVTFERLTELLAYDEDVGVFTWLETRGRVNAGDTAGYFDFINGYIVIRVDRLLYPAHRLAWLYVYGVWPPYGVDHKDMVKTNNRITNLREATQSQNNANTRKRKNSQSCWKGIRYHKRDRLWQARVKDVSIGYSKCPAAANFMYQIAADKHFGEFARFA